MKRQRTPAPRRKVTSCELIVPKDRAAWGRSPFYLVKLECGHVLHRAVSRGVAKFIFCKRCLEEMNDKRKQY